jgi:hypothetical protein
MYSIETSFPFANFLPSSYASHTVYQARILLQIRLISRTYFWPRLSRDVRAWARGYQNCQKAKIARHTKTPYGRFSDSDRFEKIHTDIIILPEVDGFKYAISFIDRATRWIECKPLRQTEAIDVAETFLDVWISRFGVPHHLVSDRGPQF